VTQRGIQPTTSSAATGIAPPSPVSREAARSEASGDLARRFRRWRTHAWLAAIVVLALALRLAWIAVTDTEIPPLSDPQYYHATATNIADGRGYTVAVDDRGFVAGPVGEPTAFWPPGYPAVLGAAYKLTGPDQRDGKIINALAGALTALPIFFLARRARGRRRPHDSDDRAGLLAAALFAVAPALIFWTPALFSEPLFTLGVATTLALALWAGDRVARSAAPSALAAAFAVGLTLAATAFVRSQGMLLLAPVVVLFVAASLDRGCLSAAGPRRPHRRAAVHAATMLAAALAGLAVLVVPWAVRNDRAMGSPYLINDNLGYNLRLAHGPYSNGTSTPPQDLWDERPGLSFYDRELFFAGEGTSRAITYAREHPGRELQLAAKRIGWLLRSDAAPAMRWSESLGRTAVPGPRDALVLLGDAYWYALLVLAATSLLLAPRTRVWLALWSLIAAWLAMHIVFAGEPRYHVPLMPALCILAAITWIGRGEAEIEDEKGTARNA
jgi:hypothetical protein